MAKAFGFSEEQAYDMGASLTKLAGDVASFYNLSQDEAYTKLKSVFTGETESLKDLGVVMTQTALDSYAMANGFGKTTAKMSEAEKVALRYSFVQNQLAAAQGDFARTSGSWANQIRILTLQFDSLKATIGQGLINLFTPVIRVINTVIGKLITLANAFKSFTELIIGQKSSNSASGQISAIGSAAIFRNPTMVWPAQQRKQLRKCVPLWASTRSINWTVIHPETVQRQVLEAVWERLASAELELILEICPGEKLS